MATKSDDKLPAAAAKPPSPSTTQSQSQPQPQSEASANAELQRIPQTRLPIKTYHCAFCNHLLLASTSDLSSLPRRREPARDKALILPLPKADEGEEEEEEEEEESENESEAGNNDTNTTTTTTTNSQQNADSPEAKNKKKKKSVKAKLESTLQRHLKQQQHYTILLSTTTPDRQPTMIRREDGFEKRLLLRCGRCRVVMGYALDEVHFANTDHNKFGSSEPKVARREGGGRGEGGKGKESAEGGDDEEEEGRDKEQRERERKRKKAEEVVYILPGALVETEEMGKREIRVETEEWAGWEKEKK
ncbi:hypothetical protein ACJ72_08416 [Emergomyces africanus]|uniref:STEEP1 domain-containing protein n=1 Tax=Emergomyces africanus TaxID=1955775 RepID=A0A1B7NKI3_9EURO|nr:hypothetical protein ACJ72_08416 [Emergomyces africanus]